MSFLNCFSHLIRFKGTTDRIFCKDDTRRRQWQPTPVLLPGKSHGRRSLVGCSPWGRSELNTTERLHFHFSLSCIGNGNPLQYSCLENPRDGGPDGLLSMGLHSRTRLKLLSSSSSSKEDTDSPWYAAATEIYKIRSLNTPKQTLVKGKVLQRKSIAGSYMKGLSSPTLTPFPIRQRLNAALKNLTLEMASFTLLKALGLGATAWR